MFVILNEWQMVISEFGALTREFYIVEIGTWENYGRKRVWLFMEGRYNEVLLFLISQPNHMLWVHRQCLMGMF